MRSSASITTRMSAVRSFMTRAVFCVATSSTGSFFRSTQPIHSSRPEATISMPPPRGRLRRRPRFCRRIARLLSSLFPSPSAVRCSIIFALSVDLVLGYAGIVTLGHAAFFGTGAYTAGILAANGWGEPISGVLAAAAVAAALGPTSVSVMRRNLARADPQNCCNPSDVDARSRIDPASAAVGHIKTAAAVGHRNTPVWSPYVRFAFKRGKAPEEPRWSVRLSK